MAEDKDAANEINMSNISLGPKVFFQTLKVKMISDKKEVSLRIVLDSRSQRSYILKRLAEEMGYIPVRKETMVHSLFGGLKSEKFEHTYYQIRLRSLENNFACNFEALNQLTICNDVTPVNAGPWMKKLQEMKLTLTDVGEKSQTVQVLIGADLFGKEQEYLTKEHFLQTVKYNDDKRYEVHLPWLDNYNFELAIRKLESTTKKLLYENLYDAYEGIFLKWRHECIIEEVIVDEVNLSGNYLPHRSVIKENSTTLIRPVFGASARMKGHPSLNEYLHSGPNLIELISNIPLRFREKKIGVPADIRKAFIQINICKEDRDFLRFLWWKNKDCQEHKVFRHARVVFGVRSSSFLLEDVLKYHLAKNCDVDPFVTKCLSNSFYEDYILISVHNESELKHLINV
ncbi:hypothetical protein AVEN_84250-1 [Araneus ventricosus]|uniref:Uncharacterized protein n=1 Tax=Araneus ventricosus TaxID=182803 RepID=A0A4Y2J1S9_ARAVE|nr:hypothetical protein AVEN_84250-1 [Araneus ventricosus]